MTSGTALLMFGPQVRKHEGFTPFLTMWLRQDASPVHWYAAGQELGPVSVVPRAPERVVDDALVLLLGLTTSARDPVPVALSEMAGGLAWARGRVDLSAWRTYDAERLDSLVDAADPGGRVVLTLLPEARVPEQALVRLAALDWDLDVLRPSLSRRREDRDLHQAPPPRLPGPPRPAQHR